MAAVSNLFGTRDRFHGRQIFHGWGREWGVVSGRFKRITFIEFVEQEAELRRNVRDGELHSVQEKLYSLACCSPPAVRLSS